MTDNLPDLVAVISAILVIVAVIFGAVAVAWSSAAKSRTALLESNNKTLEDRVRILEDEAKRKDAEHTAERERLRAEHVQELAEVQARAEGLAHKVAALEQVVTGRETLDQIVALLTAHDQRVDGFMLQQQRQDKDAADRHTILADMLTANNNLLNQLAEGVGE